MTTVTVTAGVTKRCPYRDEYDHGSVTLVFDVADDEDGPELHDLSDKIDAYQDERLSHEHFTRQVVEVFGAVRATSTWTTAGLAVTVEAP